MKFEKLKKSHKKEIIIGGLVVLGVLSAITLTSIAKYRLTQNIVRETVNKSSKTIAVFIKQDNGIYESSTNIPSSGYTLNTEKSVCSNGAIPSWENNTLNLTNFTKENTKCYLYFDKIVGGA